MELLNTQWFYDQVSKDILDMHWVDNGNRLARLQRQR